MDFHPEVLLSKLASDLSYVSLTEVQWQAARSLEESLLKKWIPKNDARLADVAINGFITANAKCRDLKIDRTHHLYSVVEIMKHMLYDMFHDGPFQTSNISLTECLSLGKAGPGASRLTRHTDFFHKMFAGRMSTTSSVLYHHYRTHISERWQEAELVRQNLYGLDIVNGSKLSTVPKNAKTNRTICTEPTLNMFYQLGAGQVIEGKLKRYFNISFKKSDGTLDQPSVNAWMAKQGSIDGSLATIDLKAASDTISNELLNHILPSSVLNTLRVLRSPVTDVNGEEVQLHMISSMGNGFTFPLQTIVFATLVKACYLHLGITPYVKNDIRRNLSVFGDDIICDVRAYDTVCGVLTLCGLTVNSEKSYSDGFFRESCGADFWKGYNIRGVFLTKVNNEQDVYSAFNRLVRWSARHGIFISAVLLYLKGLADFRPVPFDEADDAGFKCPGEYITSRQDRHGARYYLATVNERDQRKLAPAILDYHYDGALISVLGGYIRDHKYTVRITAPRAQIVKKRTPSWDYIPHVGLTIQDYLNVFQFK